jgi:hypothetical protein
MPAPRPKVHYLAGGETAPIRWPKQATLDGVKVYGHMFPDTGHISISSRYTESQQAWTLLHEFLHAVFIEWGEPMIHDGEARLGDHMEKNREAWVWLLERLTADRPKRS